MYQRRGNKTVAGAAALLLGAAGLTAITVAPAQAAVSCEVEFDANSWTSAPGEGGFTAYVTIVNTGDPIDGWTLDFDLAADHGFTQGWSADWSVDGQAVSATSPSWNQTIESGGSAEAGFNGTWSGSFTEPTSFTVNGVQCGEGPGENQHPEVSVTGPSAGQQFDPGTDVPLSADASDDSAVDHVEFLVDGASVGTDDSAPYSATAPGLAEGSHSVVAVAYDDGTPQLSTESNPVTFSVGDGLSEPVLEAAPGSLSLVEGDESTVTVTLSDVPGETVNVTASASDNVSAAPSSFTLDDGTYATGQDVAVAGVSEGSGTVTFSAPGFDDVVVPVTVTTGQIPPRAENPYAGADVYVNPEWASSVQDQAADTGGELGAAMDQVATYPTFVWMDRIGAITDGTGLAGHLDNAVAQDAANGDTPTVFQVVVYDLPNRDCAASASNGELRISENGFEIYREQFIDPIVDVLNDPAYANLRIVTVLEVDSLPNLVTNLDVSDCAEADGPGGYRDGIRYALNELQTVPNVYSYLDIAHSGWLGWDSNFGPAVDLYVDTLTSSEWYGPAPGLDSVAGFVSNSANYTPTVEPFLPDSSATPPGGGNPVRSADFYEWNPYFDELTFAQALHDEFSSAGMDEFGMLIDTSRNGWGGADRPTEVSDSTDVNTYVDESRVDRRSHRGSWCNQDGAGIGERPVASPADNVDAYVWVKPPGESDGVADPDAPPDPDDPAKQHDVMCDPEGQNTYDPSKPTNAMPGAPHAGRWFPEQFAMLVENAYPPLD